MLTGPLQIVASGNIQIPANTMPGPELFLVGQTIYNVLGGPVGTDPGAFLDYNSNTIRCGARASDDSAGSSCALWLQC